VTDRSLEALCKDCGTPLSFRAGETRPARCPGCFDRFLSAKDAEFLSSYGELGVTSRRIVAETCLRALVLESPPHRKVLAMSVIEQYILAASDLIGLYNALKQRGRQPLMRAFMDSKLDRDSALAFFREISTVSPRDFLDGLGLPMPDRIAERCPSLSKSDVEDLRRAMEQMLSDLRYIADMGEGSALALAQMAGERRIGPALANQTKWLDGVGLRKDQVAALSIDERRRMVNVSAIAVDEKKLQNVVTAINAMTRAAQDMIYAVLTMYQEDGRRQGPRDVT
jgi:hypothetical protein